jgi:hypothetical protein
MRDITNEQPRRSRSSARCEDGVYAAAAERRVPVDAPRTSVYVRVVRRILMSLALGYVVLALFTKAKEAAGLQSCDCYPDCWCRKPGLSLFRWVFPQFHHNAGLEAWKKRRLGEAE